MLTTQTKGKPILSWTDGVYVEDNAWKQLSAVAELPFIYKHVAVMPDVHAGVGSTVGTVIATKGAIVPSAVGVDIGCGVAAVTTNTRVEDFYPDLAELRAALESVVPHGRSNNGDNGDVGAWSDDSIPNGVLEAWYGKLDNLFNMLPERIKKSRRGAMRQLGTLGTGNHFLEVCLDKDGLVCLLVHTGSRGLGAHIGDYFSKLAYQDIERWTFKVMKDRALAYIPTHSENFKPYIDAVSYAQAYARCNRSTILSNALSKLAEFCPKLVDASRIECVHNYLALENHFGSNVWVTRKGAVRARKTDVVIIPGSMGARTFIARGLGNPESFTSCSHGAGRLMSRHDARQKFTVEDHVKATSGIECLKTESVLDETPGAYKNINDVMHAQCELVASYNELRQIICIKGA